MMNISKYLLSSNGRIRPTCDNGKEILRKQITKGNGKNSIKNRIASLRKNFNLTGKGKQPCPGRNGTNSEDGISSSCGSLKYSPVTQGNSFFL